MYKAILSVTQHQLARLKDDYKAGRIDIKTLQYTAKQLGQVEQRILLVLNQVENQVTKGDNHV